MLFTLGLLLLLAGAVDKKHGRGALLCFAAAACFLLNGGWKAL